MEIVGKTGGGGFSFCIFMSQEIQDFFDHVPTERDEESLHAKITSFVYTLFLPQWAFMFFFKCKNAQSAEKHISTVYSSPTNFVFPAKIGLFYFTFYVVLSAMFTIMLWVFFQTLNAQQPRWKLESSLIGTNPGKPKHITIKSRTAPTVK